MDSSSEWYLLEGINPEPWTTSEVSLIKRSGRLIPTLHKRENLRSYQEAVKEAFQSAYPNVVTEESPVEESPVEIDFYFWRQLASYQNDADKTVWRKQADATNMQKATEDALQGILFKNDNQVEAVRSTIMAQGADVAPAILICLSLPPTRPAAAQEKRDELLLARRVAGLVQSTPDYHPPASDIF